MFSGIIQQIGTVSEVKNVSGRRLFTVQMRMDEANPLAVGESIAVDGVCLTVRSLFDYGFEVEVVRETLLRTTLRHYCPGQRVNIERALRWGDPLSGHMLLGHVDTQGIVEDVYHKKNKNVSLFISLSVQLLPHVAMKGSIGVNGVSLTVSHLESALFGVSLIEYTLLHTNLSYLRKGDEVNIEIDVFSRYVERLLSSYIENNKRACHCSFHEKKSS